MDRGRSAAVGQLMDCNKRAELAERKLLHEFTPTSSEFMECQYALTRMLCSHASCLLPAACCPLPAARCLLPAASRRSCMRFLVPNQSVVCGPNPAKPAGASMGASAASASEAAAASDPALLEYERVHGEKQCSCTAWPEKQRSCTAWPYPCTAVDSSICVSSAMISVFLPVSCVQGWMRG